MAREPSELPVLPGRAPAHVTGHACAQLSIRGALFSQWQNGELSSLCWYQGGLLEEVTLELGVEGPLPVHVKFLAKAVPFRDYEPIILPATRDALSVPSQP